VNLRFPSYRITAALLCLLWATTGYAGNVPQMKMATSIAPGVATPDKLETSIGTLHLNDGFPKPDTAAKIYDNQTRSMLQTDQQAPSVSSQDKELLVNADGSVDVWFGPKAPAGSEHNWVQRQFPARAGS